MDLREQKQCETVGISKLQVSFDYYEKKIDF